VDPFVSSLGRFEEKIAFVIGAYYPDESSNQLWVDKETLLPLRLIMRSVHGADSSSKVEIRYLVWWQIGETRYPSKIEFYQDDNLVRVSQAQNFEENAIFSEDLFDIEYLKSVYPRAALQPIPPEAAEEPSEVQKTIEDFKRIFE
jgi:outer membrane lipoprotein-sorting protein